MSKEKYLNIFPRQMETMVFIILQLFFATRAVLKIAEYIGVPPSLYIRVYLHGTERYRDRHP